MKVEFSDHAIAQLSNRPRIKREMVLAAINSPDSASVSYRHRHLYRKRHGSETLEIVAVIEGDTIVVITQYFLDQL